MLSLRMVWHEKRESSRKGKCGWSLAFHSFSAFLNNGVVSGKVMSCKELSIFFP